MKPLYQLLTEINDTQSVIKNENEELKIKNEELNIEKVNLENLLNDALELLIESEVL
jgi:hypothetical protein